MDKRVRPWVGQCSGAPPGAKKDQNGHSQGKIDYDGRHMDPKPTPPGQVSRGLVYRSLPALVATRLHLPPHAVLLPDVCAIGQLPEELLRHVLEYAEAIPATAVSRQWHHIGRGCLRVSTPARVVGWHSDALTANAPLNRLWLCPNVEVCPVEMSSGDPPHQQPCHGTRTCPCYVHSFSVREFPFQGNTFLEH